MTEKAAGQPVYLLNAGGDPERFESAERKFKAAIPDLIKVANITDIDRQSSGPRGYAFVLVVALAADAEYFNKLVDIVTRYRGHYFFILVSSEVSATDYKRLVQSGSADWVPEAAPAQEILDIIARHQPKPREAPLDAGRPLVVSFVPSAGGVGTTTLAIETAIQLNKAKAKQAKQRKVCLVDLDFQTSHVCDYLDIDPRLRIDEIMGAHERLDDQLFEMFASHHQSGLDVFAAARSKFHPWDLDIAALDALFDKIAKRYETILIELPVAWYPWTEQILRASQGMIVIGLNTIPGLRQIFDALSAIRSLAGIHAQIAVALNRTEYGLFGRVLRHRHVKSVLGNEKLFFVRNARMAIDCINAGSPMTLANPSHRAVKDIAAIAEFCASLKPAQAGKK
jgi:pilus assembly protein CpaE